MQTCINVYTIFDILRHQFKLFVRLGFISVATLNISLPADFKRAVYLYKKEGNFTEKIQKPHIVRIDIIALDQYSIDNHVFSNL